jgi:hypothetical protein
MGEKEMLSSLPWFLTKSYARNIPTLVALDTPIVQDTVG